MPFESMGNGHGSSHDDPPEEPRRPEKERINWKAIENSVHNRALVLIGLTLGAQAHEIAGLLKEHGAEMTERQRMNMTRANVRNWIAHRHGGRIEQFSANLAGMDPKPSEATQRELYSTVYEYMRTYCPERLWQFDRHLVALTAYLLGEGRATLNQVRLVLEKCMNVTLSTSLIYDRLESRSGRDANKQTQTDELESKDRTTLIEKLTSKLTPPLTEQEIEDAKLKGERYLGELEVTAYSPENSWRRNSAARAFAAALLDAHAPVQTVTEALEHMFNVHAHYDSVYTMSPSRLRKGCTETEIESGRRDADTVMEMYRAAHKEKDPEKRKQRLEELWRWNKAIRSTESR